jgi:NitT/TauT family transport system permease protein
MKKTPLASRLLPFGVFVLFLIFWYLACKIFSIPAYILPTPDLVAKAVVENFDKLVIALKITFIEAVGGFLISIILGLVFALIFAQSTLIHRCFYPYTILLQTVPIVAIAPLLIMWFGTGIHSVMLVAIIICTFPILANTTQGLRSVDKNLLNLFKMCDASSMDVLWKLRFPNALPYFFAGLKISSGLSVIGAITGELFASSNTVGEGGLGYSITYANSQLQTDYLFALVLTSVVLGSFVSLTVMGISWYFLHQWHESSMKEDAE